MKLSRDQRRIVSESVANIGVTWFAGGVVASVFTAKTIAEALVPSVWVMILTILFVFTAVLLVRSS